jgi:hypothetical protein
MGDMPIYVGLDCIICFRRTNDKLGCVIHTITGDYAEAVVVASDPDAFKDDDVELRILLPVERSPIRCTGRISADRSKVEGSEKYSAKVFISSISRLDQRRLEVFIERKKAFIGGGSNASFPYIN